MNVHAYRQKTHIATRLCRLCVWWPARQMHSWLAIHFLVICLVVSGQFDFVLMIFYVFIILSVIYSVQLAHGADPTLKNQEGQTPLDLTMVSIIM